MTGQKPGRFDFYAEAAADPDPPRLFSVPARPAGAGRAGTASRSTGPISGGWGAILSRFAFGDTIFIKVRLSCVAFRAGIWYNKKEYGGTTGHG